jgi:hypothetical protein
MPNKTTVKKSAKSLGAKKNAPVLLPAAAAADPLKFTATTGPKVCKPFVLEVMIFAPASGFKIEVKVEKGCTPQADPIWKIVFDLFKKKPSGDGFDQLVHVSFTGQTPVQQKGIETTAANGINEKQADVIVNEAGPAVLDLKDSATMKPSELEATKEEVKAAAGKVAEFAL